MRCIKIGPLGNFIRQAFGGLELGCILAVILLQAGCTPSENKTDVGKVTETAISKSEILITGVSEDALNIKGIVQGLQKDGNSVVVDGQAGFETGRYSVEDIRVAAYMDALGELSEFICTSINTSVNESYDSKRIRTQSELAFGECTIKTFFLQEEDGDDGSSKNEIGFFKANDLLYRFSYEEPKGGGEVVSLKNKLKLSELMKLLADSKYTVKVISERAILKGRGAVKKDGGIDEVVRFNALEGGGIEFIVVLNVSGIKLRKEE